MLIFFQELCLLVFLWVLRLVDGIMEIFSSVAGIADVNYNGENVNIIEYALSGGTLNTIFWCVLILAVGLCGIFTIAALVKNMITAQKSVSGVVGKFFLAILGSFAMIAAVVLAILISNAVLSLVSKIFRIGNTTKLSNAIFDACAGEWINGYTATEFNVNTASVKEIFGDYTTGFVFPDGWKYNGMVNPDGFLYLPSLIAGIALLLSLITAVLNLAKRVYEIIVVYLVMPVSLSTLPLDEGARFKIWRETLITKIIIAYGAVFAVNVFVLLMPIVTKAQVVGAGGFANSIFKIFMIVGGSMTIPAGQAMFARMFGQADDMRAGGGVIHSVYNMSRMLTMTAIHTASRVIHGGIGAGKSVYRKIRNKKGDSGGEDNSDKYSEDKTSAETNTENATPTGGE